MDDKLARKLYKRAVEAAKSYGKYQDAEDLAQSVLLKFLQNGKPGQSVKYGVIDAMRDLYGRTGSNKNNGIAISIETLPLRDHPTMPENVKIDKTFLARLVKKNLISGEDHAAFLLIYEWGFTGREVAALFSCDPVLINFRLKKVLRYYTK